jgi:cysteine-rich repeat protein
VQIDSDQDGVGDACDQCNGRPDPGVCDGCPGVSCPPICNSSPATVECACGDGTLDLPSEQCDLGTANNDGDPCTATCQIAGKCTTANTPCVTAADCPVGEGCCGNDIVEGPEQCDDGNSIPNDTCANNCTLFAGPPILGCEDLTGPNVIPASIKTTKFKDKPSPADFDRWKTKGTFVFAQGLTVDPDSQPVKIIYNNILSGELFSSQLDPGDCNPPLATCFVQSGTPTKPKWKFLDKEADLAGAPSWHKGKFKIKNVNNGTFNLDGRNVTLFSSAELGTGSLRQTIRVGDVCITGLVSCTLSGNAKSYKCSLVP